MLLLILQVVMLILTLKVLRNTTHRIFHSKPPREILKLYIKYNLLEGRFNKMLYLKNKPA